MDIMIIGSGGREHAIIKKISESKHAGKLYAVPGNGGIASIAECIDLKATDIDGVIKAAKEKNVDLVFVASDDPLALGMVDKLEEAGIRAFGPRANAAIIEGSKVFSKSFMKKYNIPTAAYETFDSKEEACEYIRKINKYPTVIKAEGLALGKGVVIAQNYDEAENAVKSMIEDRVFGDSGGHVVIEEFLTGREVTVLAFTDGKTVKPMVSSQDHKRAFDGDKGLNTGGMGTYSPSPIFPKDFEDECMRVIFQPTIDAMRKEERTFKGVIYFELMITEKGPYVIEYNARFGDPETQVVLPRLETDLIDIIDAVIDERLDEIEIKWKDNCAVCVVIASGGYPVSYEKGFEITGIDEANKCEDTFVYHAGTAVKDGKIVTSGGRVLGVTSTGISLDEARKKAYAAAEKISFNGMFYRKDIGSDANSSSIILTLH